MLPINEILEKVSLKDKSHLPSGEYFLSLTVGEKQVRAGICSFTERGGETLAYGSSEAWSGESAEELIVAADTSIAAAVAKLPEVIDKQPTKVILGLPDFWVEDDTVKEKKREILGIVCKKLLLKPLGFVVAAEAIAHLLKKKEGGTPDVILVSVAETEITVSLIAQGKFLGSKIVGRSSSLALDLEEGLLRFNLEGSLPTRILLLGGESLEEEKQALISYPWISPEGEKKLGFLQFPNVEIAGEDLEVSAVVLAGSHELGWGVNEKPPAEQKTEKPVPEEEIPVSEESESFSLPKEDFGFIKGKDILAVSPPIQPAVEEVVMTEELLAPEDGFKKPKVTELPKAALSLSRHGGFKSFLGKIGKIFTPIRFLLSLFSRKAFLVVIGFLLVLAGAGFWGFKKAVRSEIKIFVRPQKIEKEFEFTVSTKEISVDSEKMVLPAKEISVDVSGKKTAGVTGKKMIGEKAVGEVIIYNRTDQIKTFSKGSVLKGPAGLRFVLDEEVKVASKTADLIKYGPIDKWGEAKAKVVAENIGAQYNIAADSLLSLESLPSSTLVIKAAAAFSGGTSREIQAVSKEDQENLQKEIFKDLESKAKEEIKSKISEADYLLEGSLKLKTKTDHFDSEVGDEAVSLSLEEKATFSSLYFKNEDLKILTKKVISPLVSEKYQKEPVKKEENVVVKDKAKEIYLARVKHEFLPELEEEGIALRLRGKSFVQAEDYLKTLTEVAGIEISVQPKIFSKFKIFPLDEKNILVRIEAI